MATLGLHGQRQSGGLRPGGSHLRVALAIGIVLLVPLAGCITILSLKQVIPRHSYAADGGDCSRYTQLAFKPGAPSPTFLPAGDRCEIADYDGFVQAAKAYNLRRGAMVGLVTLLLMAALLLAVLRGRS